MNKIPKKGGLGEKPNTDQPDIPPKPGVASKLTEEGKVNLFIDLASNILSFIDSDCYDCLSQKEGGINGAKAGAIANYIMYTYDIKRREVDEKKT